jgi:hypothetical protein
LFTLTPRRNAGAFSFPRATDRFATIDFPCRIISIRTEFARLEGNIKMLVSEAQQEVRDTFAGGAVGQAVSGLLWLISAALATFVSQRTGIIALIGMGFFIFPLTQLALRLLGRKAGLSKANPFTGLAMQTAFIIPLTIPVVGAAALYNANWFYPAFMIVLGTHYMPFMTLYGMWQYGILAAVLIFGGLAIALWIPGTGFALGGWFTAAVLFVFALVVALSRRPKR